MDLSCIISSGDLELYLLGMLPQDEAAKIEQLALLFPEIQEELDRISGSLLSLADTAQVAPAPSVKEGLMQQLQALKEAEEALAAPVIPLQSGRNLNLAAHPATPEEAPVVAMPATRRRTAAWFSAASFIGFLLALGGVIFFASKNKQSQSELAQLQQNVQTLNRSVVELQRDNLAASQMVQMLQSDVYRKIPLKAIPGKPDALVQLMWNTQTKEVFVNNVSLPQTPAGRQYQLWAIVDGKPVDAGMLGNGRNRVQQMKTFERAEAFAITLEQEGGSAVPTMEQMMVMGKA